MSGNCTKSEKKETVNQDVIQENPDKATVVDAESNETGNIFETPGNGNTPDAPNQEHTGNQNMDTAPSDIPKGPTDGVVTIDKYIYSDYPSDNLPMEKLERMITNENQVVYVKIRNAKAGETISVKAEHENPDGNIAVNHVYGPGTQDGPFGREATYKIPKNGDYTFAISKNNRAEGSTKGKVLVSVVKK